MLDLTTFNFTDLSDVANFTDTLTIPPDLSPAVGIFNEDLVKALSGSDLIEARLTATLGNSVNVTITGLANNTVNSEILTGRGLDQILGHIEVDGGEDSDLALFGIDNTDGSIKTGKAGDRIEGSVIATDDGSSAIEAFGFQGGLVKTQGGQDKVKGFASAEGGSDSGAFAVGIANADIETGHGHNLVRGKAIAQSGLGPDATGLFFTNVTGGSDDDRVIGVAEISGMVGGPAGLAKGIDGFDGEWASIRTRDGDDLIEGKAKVSIEAGAEGTGQGIDGGRFKTGHGDDIVSGRVVVDIADGGDGSGAIGINDAAIDTDKGRDVIIGESITTVAEGALTSDASNSRGINGDFISLFDDSDTIIGRVTKIGGENDDLSNNSGINNVFLFTGEGRDNVLGEVEVRGGINSDVSASSGISNSNIFINEGGKVIGRVFAEAGDGSNVGSLSGIYNTTFTTGPDSDKIKGKVSISVTGTPSEAFGTGLDGNGWSISTGRGDDEVIGIGADIAIGGESYGIKDYSISLDRGDDTVYARGATAGVKDVHIKGFSGDDLFDLHSGTGLVNGGRKEDTLVLSGNSGDFTFTNNGGTAGNITDSGVTDLDVKKIENFRFDNGLFSFDELFVV
ncbi:hypothetical protein [Bauldia sp.]|uniref:hypothetical protein n=1 Tax=Bauldia sp. TaxID=2575872 RepID=UPI003BA8EBA5